MKMGTYLKKKIQIKHGLRIIQNKITIEYDIQYSEIDSQFRPPFKVPCVVGFLPLEGLLSLPALAVGRVVLPPLSVITLRMALLV